MNPRRPSILTLRVSMAPGNQTSVRERPSTLTLRVSMAPGYQTRACSARVRRPAPNSFQPLLRLPCLSPEVVDILVGQPGGDGQAMLRGILEHNADGTRQVAEMTHGDIDGLDPIPGPQHNAKGSTLGGQRPPVAACWAGPVRARRRAGTWRSRWWGCPATSPRGWPGRSRGDERSPARPATGRRAARREPRKPG